MSDFSPHPQQLFQCHVLHRRDYTNTSLLLELFCAEYGRLPAIAKGARRSRSGAAGLLQVFQPLWVKVSGRGEVKTLTSTEAAGPGAALKGKALYCGFYLNELLMRLLGRYDAQPQLYALYLRALAELGRDQHLFSTLRRFEIGLLRETGYAMVLERDTQGNPLRAQQWYAYDPEQGPIAVPLSAPGRICSGATLLALARGDNLDAQQAKQARSLMRWVLSHHLGDKPLKSRELFK